MKLYNATLLLLAACAGAASAFQSTVRTSSRTPAIKYVGKPKLLEMAATMDGTTTNGVNGVSGRRKKTKEVSHFFLMFNDRLQLMGKWTL